MVKPKVAVEMDFSSTQLGVMDMTYLLCYGLGNMINGNLGDSFPLRWVVSSGLMLTAIILMVTSALGYFHVDYIPLFTLLWAGNGLAQSAVWPGTVALIGNWFPRLTRGKVMGIWSSNSSVGDCLGAVLAGIMLGRNYSWEAIVLTTALVLLLVSVTFALTTEDKPPVSLIEDDLLSDMEFNLIVRHRASIHKTGIQFSAAWKIRQCKIYSVRTYSLTYACVKLLTYGMLFWLPFFLTRKIEVSGEAVGQLTASFAVGGMFGGCISGWLTDWIEGNRSFVLMPMLILTIPLLFFFKIGSTDTQWLFFLVIPLTGVMNVGASNLMSSAVPADLAERSEFTRSEEAKATVTGIMNGTGALGAAAGAVLIGWLQTFSWDYVFWFLIGVEVLAIGLLALVVIADYREWKMTQKNM